MIELVYLCTMKKSVVLGLILLALFVDHQLYAQGCSQCRMLSEQASELDESSFGSNINTGILYLMAVPYVLLLLLFRKRIVRFFKAMAKSH
jgi:hypothetical protein